MPTMSEPAPGESFLAALARFYQSDKSTDGAINCEPYHFKIHKILVSAHSEVLGAMLEPGKFKEGNTGVIDLLSTQSQDGSSDPSEACDEPEIVKLMIEYFYHFDYLRRIPAETSVPDSPTQTGPSDSSLEPEVYVVQHAKVFALAIKYRISGLRDLAARKFSAALKSDWKHEDFPRAINVVYQSIPRDIKKLRHMVLITISEHLDHGMLPGSLEDELRDTPGFALDLLRPRNELKRTDCGHLSCAYNLEDCGVCGDEYSICDACEAEHGVKLCPKCWES